jgi:2'-hydroxyisoflavone reductase
VKLLILGGTLFVGRHLVEAALSRQHEVTLFNRGLSNAGLYVEVERLRGDRGGDMTALRGRRWDAVIDTCGYLPQHVQASAELLADAVEHYTFISTLSVYREQSMAGADESAPLLMLAKEHANALSRVKTLGLMATDKFKPLYGPLKVLCERAVENVMPGRALTIRAGLIVGPHEYREGIAYWVRRVAQGGDVLAPGRPGRPVQFIDGRDLAEWVIRMVERRQTGPYNVTGPDYVLTMQQFLRECVTTCGNGFAHLVWVGNRFLSEYADAAEIPLWHPDEDRMACLSSVNCSKSIAAGLTLRALRETILDTLDWDASLSPEAERRGIKPGRESQLLEAWRSLSLETSSRVV